LQPKYQWQEYSASALLPFSRKILCYWTISKQKNVTLRSRNFEKFGALSSIKSKSRKPENVQTCETHSNVYLNKTLSPPTKIRKPVKLILMAVFLIILMIEIRAKSFF